MSISDDFAAGFEKGHDAGARLRTLFAEGDMSDPQIAAEIEQLGASTRSSVVAALAILHQKLADVKRKPSFRKTLEAVGLTRAEVKRLADACLAIYEDEP